MTRQWTTPDVAAELGLSESTVRAYRARGQMPEATGRVGRTPWWSPEDIEPWMTGYKHGAESRKRETARRRES